MRPSLLDTIFLSQKRKNLLLFLKDGEKDVNEIKASFDFPWKSMIPQIKKLEEWELIDHGKGKYRLTNMGDIIVESMDHFLRTLKTHEDYGNYWLEHDIAPIPKELLYRIEELGKCIILKPKLPDLFGQQEEVFAGMESSDRIMAFTAIHHPVQFIIFSNLIEKGVEMDIIVTEEVFRNIMGQVHSTPNFMHIDKPVFMALKEEYEREMDLLFNDKNSHIFIYRGEVKPLDVTVTDRSFSLTLQKKNGIYDNCILTSSEPAAISWGKELFHHYKDRSDRIK